VKKGSDLHRMDSNARAICIASTAPHPLPAFYVGTWLVTKVATGFWRAESSSLGLALFEDKDLQVVVSFALQEELQWLRDDDKKLQVERSDPDHNHLTRSIATSTRVTDNLLRELYLAFTDHIAPTDHGDQIESLRKAYRDFEEAR
jgi:hypothetical protein